MKLLPKKKYKELLDTIDHYEDRIKYLEGALSNLDSYSCTLRQQKYDLSIMNNNQECYIKSLRNELAYQKRSNRRLINLLYNPKKK